MEWKSFLSSINFNQEFNGCTVRTDFIFLSISVQKCIVCVISMVETSKNEYVVDNN